MRRESNEASMNPTLPEIAEALMAAGFDVEMQGGYLDIMPSEEQIEALGVGRHVSWLAFGAESPYVEVLARSAVLKVAPRSYAAEQIKPRRYLCVFARNDDDKDIHDFSPSRADTYTAAWLYALVALHREGLLQ